VDQPALAQQLHSTLTPVRGEAMEAVRPALAIHHALGCELAVVAVERTTMDGQGGTGLVLPPQTQPHQLGTCGAPAHRIVPGMQVHDHARGEIRDLPVLAYHCRDGVGLLDTSWRGSQVVSTVHPEPPKCYASINIHHRREVEEIRIPIALFQQSCILLRQVQGRNL
jgi:hypothetical protein